MVALLEAGGADRSLWLKVDSFSLLQALVYLAERLVDEYEIKSVSLRLAEASGRARLDLAWIGASMSTETVMSWETEPMRVGAESSPLSVRDVVVEGRFKVADGRLVVQPGQLA